MFRFAVLATNAKVPPFRHGGSGGADRARDRLQPRSHALAGIAARTPIVSPSAAEATLTLFIAYSCVVVRTPKVG